MSLDGRVTNRSSEEGLRHRETQNGAPEGGRNPRAEPTRRRGDKVT